MLTKTFCDIFQIKNRKRAFYILTFYLFSLNRIYLILLSISSFHQLQYGILVEAYLENVDSYRDIVGKGVF